MKISEKESLLTLSLHFLTLKKKKETLTLNSLENVRARARGRDPTDDRDKRAGGQAQSAGVTHLGPRPAAVRPARHLSHQARTQPASASAARQPQHLQHVSLSLGTRHGSSRFWS